MLRRFAGVSVARGLPYKRFCRDSMSAMGILQQLSRKSLCLKRNGGASKTMSTCATIIGGAQRVSGTKS